MESNGLADRALDITSDEANKSIGNAFCGAHETDITKAMNRPSHQKVVIRSEQFERLFSEIWWSSPDVFQKSNFDSKSITWIISCAVNGENIFKSRHPLPKRPLQLKGLPRSRSATGKSIQ
jgi:hypothetical protein